MRAKLVVLAVTVLAGCSALRRNHIDKILEAGYLRLITANNPHCYYIYRDSPMGFEYDLAHAFACSLGVQLDVVLPGWERMIDALDTREGDLIGASLTVTPAREMSVDFSEPYLPIRQHALVRKGNLDVRRLTDLAGREVHVRAGTSYHERLLELEELGLPLRVVLHEGVPTDELIRQVARGEIDVTIADTNIALLNRRYFPRIKVAFPISDVQSIAWAVRKGDKALLSRLNSFLASIRSDGTFGRIYQRYYANVETFDYFDLRKFHKRMERYLPRYRAAIRDEADKYGLDWTLIAAMIYQESHFDPESRSHAGALGLMQLTERTAAEVGVDDPLDPEQSIRGGVRYLHTLYERFEDVEPSDQLLFALASYNIGYGHVRDAQNIALQQDLEASRWSALRRTLPLLRKPEYYEEAEYGYARGTEPVRYVDRIMTYHDILKRKALEPAFALRTAEGELEHVNLSHDGLD
jgi:membrane-bound lytic murein transglycosylase F